jgi:hypothetical protein
MDKNTLIKMVSKIEDRVLVSRLLDKVEQCRYSSFVYSDFLSPYEAEIARKVLDKVNLNTQKRNNGIVQLCPEDVKPVPYPLFLKPSLIMCFYPYTLYKNSINILASMLLIAPTSMNATIGEKSNIESIELLKRHDLLSKLRIGASTGSVIVYSKSISLLSLDTGSQDINTLTIRTQ